MQKTDLIAAIEQGICDFAAVGDIAAGGGFFANPSDVHMD
jgi:hypothetical protein